MQLYLIAQQNSVLERWGFFLKGSSPHVIEVSDLSSGQIETDCILIVHLSSIGMEQCDEVFNFKKRNPTALIVICTDVPNEQEGVKVLQFGANGYTNTYITDSLFSEVIATVEAGNIWVGPELLQSLLKHLLVDASDKEQKHAPRSPDDIFEGLSSREKEVVSVLVTGVSNKTIARELDITERTVKAHLSSIFQKTGIADRISLILRAKEQSRL